MSGKQQLFEASTINGLTTANRFVYSATWDDLADDQGFCTERGIETLAARARGGAGLSITGMAFVKKEGRAAPWQLAVYDDAFVPGLSAMAETIHHAQGKVVLQIAHAGCYAPAALTDTPPVGPSANESDRFPHCDEIAVDEIKAVVAAFGDAAGRSKKAGFDGVQLHAAHGYLLSQFLSPFFNRRTDSYGGSLENRARLLLDAVRAVRKEVGDRYPVMVKINSQDFVEHGLSVEESLQVCSMLEKAGVDAIEVSGGTVYASGAYSCFRTGNATSAKSEPYYQEVAARLKKSASIPVMLVGGIRTLESAERLVAAGVTDYISLCRPLIREADLIRRWQRGDTGVATCLSCNGCIGPALKGAGLQCVL